MTDVIRPDIRSGGDKPPAQPRSSGESMTERASDLAGNMKQRAAEAAQDLKSKVEEKAPGMADAAKGVAAQASDQVRQKAEEQKNAGAEFGVGVAGAIRRAAGELDGHVPQAGQYIRTVADQIEEASDALRRRDFDQLVSGVQDFARRQPALFLGASMIAGFVAVRFLKSAAPASLGGSRASRAANGMRPPPAQNGSSGGYANQNYRT